MISRLGSRCTGVVAVSLLVLGAIGVGVIIEVLAEGPQPSGPFPPFGSFAGYMWHGQAKSVAGGWRVPAIEASSSPGAAAVWIGIEGANGSFVQVGTFEQRAATRGGGAKDEYIAFWSDTEVQYRAQFLGEVGSGDAVSTSIGRTRRGWQLILVDHSSTRTYARDVGGPTDGVDQAEWLEEDPSSSSSAARAVLPTLGSLTFDGLLVNGAPPRLASGDRLWMTGRGAGLIGPQATGRAAFNMGPVLLSNVQAQFLAADGRLYAALRAYRFALAGWVTPPPSPVANRYVKLLVEGFARFDEALLDHSWPAAARARLSQLEKADAREAAAARALAAAGPALPDDLSERLQVAESDQSIAINRVLAALNLAPTLPSP